MISSIDKKYVTQVYTFKVCIYDIIIVFFCFQYFVWDVIKVLNLLYFNAERFIVAFVDECVNQWFNSS